MKRYFNQVATDFNPRSLAGATAAQAKGGAKEPFSIHAPSRERLNPSIPPSSSKFFQSTLPRGSDASSCRFHYCTEIFNPRSLAGATLARIASPPFSIFQSTLPRGSDYASLIFIPNNFIFQSTLPRGSDRYIIASGRCERFFNPRSLAGATNPSSTALCSDQAFQSTLPRGSDDIRDLKAERVTFSIHAPSRERPRTAFLLSNQKVFNPRSLAGATPKICFAAYSVGFFNPRSLAGAT